MLKSFCKRELVLLTELERLYPKMVSNSLLALGVSGAVVAMATFLGTFTNGIFTETADIFNQINNGQTVTVESVISDADMARLKGISSEVEKIQAETK